MGHHSHEADTVSTVKVSSYVRCLVLHHVSVPMRLESFEFLVTALDYEHCVSA